MLKLTLFDLNENLCKEWGKSFEQYQDVKVKNCALDDLEPHDILVTAGNSLGMMGGGIDYYVNQLGKFKIEPDVRASIVQNFGGDLPVGKFITVDIDKYTKSKFKALVYAPTMPLPGCLIDPEDIKKVFKPIIEYYKDTDFTLACPGLGTATGGVAEEVAARIMAEAYKEGMGK